MRRLFLLLLLVTPVLAQSGGKIEVDIGKSRFIQEVTFTVPTSQTELKDKNWDIVENIDVNCIWRGTGSGDFTVEIKAGEEYIDAIELFLSEDLVLDFVRSFGFTDVSSYDSSRETDSITITGQGDVILPVWILEKETALSENGGQISGRIKTVGSISEGNVALDLKKPFDADYPLTLKLQKGLNVNGFTVEPSNVEGGKYYWSNAPDSLGFNLEKKEGANWKLILGALVIVGAGGALFFKYKAKGAAGEEDANVEGKEEETKETKNPPKSKKKAAKKAKKAAEKK